MKKVFISPSILTADFARLEQECKSLQKSGADWIHCDVMDGVFVPNLTFGMPILSSIRKCVVLPLDVHLMIVEPKRYVEQFAKAGADIITFHVEATKYPAEVIQQIKATGAKAGIVLNPRTPVEVVYPFIKDVDMVLVMTVEPGFGGQKFMTPCLSKIKQLAAWKEELGLDYDIEVDGGININNAREVVEAGATVVVAGSAVFEKEDIGAAAKGFLDIFKEFE